MRSKLDHQALRCLHCLSTLLDSSRCVEFEVRIRAFTEDSPNRCHDSELRSDARLLFLAVRMRVMAHPGHGRPANADAGNG